MDIGCGKGDWGHNIKRILETQHKRSKTHFHIFSITGGQECPEQLIKTQNITLHQLNQCKIENIDEELAKRWFDLNEKVDVIVSNWALRHLVDPFGTVDRLYGLLNPCEGKLFSNGFLLKFDSSKEVEGCPAEHSSILANSNATALFRDFDDMRDADQFLLERTNEKPLGLPLRYTGTTENLVWGYWCASNKITIFSAAENIIRNNTIENLENKPYRYHYCLEGDTRCKELYTRLKRQGFFDSPHTASERIKKGSIH